MSGWRPEHANQLLTAYLILRGRGGGPDAATVLHERWYAVRPPAALGSPNQAPTVAALARAAHRGGREWSAAVEVVATGPSGEVVVETSAGRRAVGAGDYVTEAGRPGFVPRTGDRVRVVQRLDSTAPGGPWRSWGAGWEHVTGGVQDCLHLVVSTARLPDLVAGLTGLLDAGDAWLLEVSAAAGDPTRVAAVNLRLAGSCREAWRDSVVAVAVGLVSGPLPPLVEILASGIGWAEEDASGESFGVLRSQLVGAAFERLGGRPADAEGWLALVADEFWRNGVDPAHPHRVAR